MWSTSQKEVERQVACFGVLEDELEVRPPNKIHDIQVNLNFIETTNGTYLH